MRYILFADSCYYPNGGCHDIKCSCDNISYLLRLIDKNGYYINIDRKDKLRNCDQYYFYEEWWHIYDTKKMIITHGSSSQPCYVKSLKVDDDFKVIGNEN